MCIFFLVLTYRLQIKLRVFLILFFFQDNLNFLLLVLILNHREYILIFRAALLAFMKNQLFFTLSSTIIHVIEDIGVWSWFIHIILKVYLSKPSSLFSFICVLHETFKKLKVECVFLHFYFFALSRPSFSFRQHL